MDYGLRLNAAGIPLMPIPGPGVSHSSFRYKHVGIVIYHDLRNLLIMASFHPEFAPRPGILTILGWTMFHVLVHRYRAGLSCLIAIEDYLAGPDVTFAVDGGQRFGIVRERVNALPVPDVWTDVGADSLPLVLPPVRDQHRARGGCVRSDPSAHRPEARYRKSRLSFQKSARADGCFGTSVPSDA